MANRPRSSRIAWKGLPRRFIRPPAPRPWTSASGRWPLSGGASDFLFPYNTKLWGTAPEELSPDWTNRKVITVGFRDAVIGALKDRALEEYPNRTFRYPATGGMSTFSRAFAGKVNGLKLGTEVVEMDLARKVVTTATG